MGRVIDEALKRANAKGWTKAEFSRRLTISPQRLTNWIARDMPPSAYKLVSGALGCSIDELVGRGTLTLTGLERQLVELYRGCAPHHQDDLLAMAQRWHNHSNPEPSAANPYAKRKTPAQG